MAVDCYQAKGVPKKPTTLVICTGYDRMKPAIELYGLTAPSRRGSARMWIQEETDCQRKRDGEAACM